MAQANFEGDLSQLSELQLKFISEVLEKHGFSDAKVTISAVGEAGDNYVANVKRIVAEKNGETLSIVAKVAPSIEQMRVMMNTRLLFCNEHAMYTQILPKYTELEKAAGTPQDERLRYAACYGTLMEDCNELILLEDLKIDNFTMLDRFKSLTDQEVRLVLKDFARLHSLSYALRYQEPDTFNNCKNSLVDFWRIMAQMEQMSQYFEASEIDCIEVLNEQKYKDALKGTFKNFFDIGQRLYKVDENSRYAVIQQGDSWTNNIMFKLKEGTAVSCCMIDYQLSRINSPVADLHYMIFNCTDHAIRKQNFYDWIDYYHKELENSLFEFGLKVNYVYPRDQLDADLKRHGKMAFALGVLLATTLCRESAQAAKFKEAMENFSEDNMEEIFETNKLSASDENTLAGFRSRVHGLVDSFLEFGLL